MKLRIGYRAIARYRIPFYTVRDEDNVQLSMFYYFWSLSVSYEVQ